ncbi:uncharacterized protein LOC133184803 [Saccostrea echinata]|uniref:uncharacterized protein LOC133184803 n=1 Tax=Saccostrea echinata TaxID=191078 RepID=UPI002A8305FF|nr:uncharacterized protein LOC133184803 [Saccostrea echinata]
MKTILFFFVGFAYLGYFSISMEHIQREICKAGTASLNITVGKEVLLPPMIRGGFHAPLLVIDPPYRKKREVWGPLGLLPKLISCRPGKKYDVTISKVFKKGTNTDFSQKTLITVIDTKELLKPTFEYFVTASMDLDGCIYIISAREWKNLNVFQKRWLKNNKYADNCRDLNECFKDNKLPEESDPTFECYDRFSFCSSRDRRLRGRKGKLARCIRRNKQ